MLANSFPKIGDLIVNRVIDFQDDHKAITSAPIRTCVSSSTKSQRGNVPRIGLQMIKQSIDGLLFFAGGRELRIVAYDVSQTSAVVHSDGLGLVPISFYVTFDDFLTVGKCRLAWRCRDDVGVVFERWLDVRRRLTLEQSR